MKIIKLSILLTVTAIGFFSCQKTGSSITPTHPVVDTTYLRKTEIMYGYDASGNKSTDSTIWKWAYDDQRRPTSVIGKFNNGRYIDSSITTYSPGHSTMNLWIFNEGIISSIQQADNFYNAEGSLDSVRSTFISINPNNGSPDTTRTNGVWVYYNDANGLDTMDVFYDLSSGGRAKGSTVVKIYVNNNLSKQLNFSPTGIRTYLSSWTGGNVILDTVWNYNDGSLAFIHSYDYSSVLSGGFYGYTGTKNLETQATQINVSSPGSNYTTTETYTFDDVNRVSTQKEVVSNMPGYTLIVYTYY
jgi:hypothetical protein